MKELSIEEKAKAYDKVREKIALRFGSNVAEEIFSEYEESEDERMRNAAINACKYMVDNFENSTKQYEEAIAWLEKQGEHAKFRDSIQVGDKVTRNEDGVLVNLSQLNRVAKKQGEQKPAEDVNLPEFESYLCLMLQKFRTKGMCTNGEIIDYVKEHSQKLRNILVKPAWSEEDEELLNTIINHFKVNVECTDDDDIIKWLNSLKNRVQPQPKQEWSEEDERIRIETIELLETANHPNKMRSNGKPLDFTENINWLKSLKDRYTWKPSDEMLEALYRAVPKNVKEMSEDEMLFDKLYQGLKYGRVLSEK